jgi:glyoxylase-like metal-dependent hydrolase (beta-lactamase superfamily II)
VGIDMPPPQNEIMKQSDDNRIIPMTSVSSGHGEEVRPDLYYYTNQIVNVIMIGSPESGDWFLIDAGMPESGEEIQKAAEDRFGRKPAAILLTHGHFDHVGGIVHLLKAWDCPVYAHTLEFPFLTGVSAYPEPDPSVQGKLLAKIASIYPYKPVDISEKLLPLPEGGAVPGLAGWKWIHAPGHAPGQVVFFRESDRALISADAFVTVRQDSLYKVLFQKKEVNGPPRYFTADWKAAEETVKRLAALEPSLVISGHGQFMEGDELKKGLRDLVENFGDLALPDHGKYVDPQE